MKFHSDRVEDWTGFATGNAQGGDSVTLLTRGLITSDDPEFYHYTEQISNTFVGNARISIDSVYKFLVIIHQDLSADLYVNDFPVIVEIKAKRSIEQGEVVMLGDIADIQKVTFPQVTIVDTDKVIYCFKIGWRFGLFFDLTPRIQPPHVKHSIHAQKLDVKKMEFSIGDLHRYLSFYHVYKTLESGDQFEEMVKDGWFPFIEILADEYRSLRDTYQNKFNFEERIGAIVDKINAERIAGITKKWWKNKIYEEKKQLIEAGINAYLQNTPDGFVNCIKNLLTEIEGILRKLYLAEKARGDRVTQGDLISYIIQKAKAKTASDHSLFFPLQFLKYLQDVIFADFDLEAGSITLSRHSSSHGVATPQQYTKSRALQLILILDQIYFYS